MRKLTVKFRSMMFLIVLASTQGAWAISLLSPGDLGSETLVVDSWGEFWTTKHALEDAGLIDYHGEFVGGHKENNKKITYVHNLARELMDPHLRHKPNCELTGLKWTIALGSVGQRDMPGNTLELAINLAEDGGGSSSRNEVFAVPVSQVVDEERVVVPFARERYRYTISLGDRGSLVLQTASVYRFTFEQKFLEKIELFDAHTGQSRICRNKEAPLF